MRWMLMLSLVIAAAACAANEGSMKSTEQEKHLSAMPSDTRWRLVSSDIEGLQGERIDVVRLQVEQDTLKGEGGCNQFFAGYHMDTDGVISMQPVVSSKRACADAARNAVEQSLLAALRDLQTAGMRGEQLVLHTASGGHLVFSADPLVAE